MEATTYKKMQVSYWAFPFPDATKYSDLAVY